jgi:NADH:ubiquinone oxidoreductase subunit K
MFLNKMMVESLNMLFLFFFLILFSILINTNTSIHLLLTAELLWITLYTIVLLLGLIYDNLNLLSLTFFFLVFSAIEFGVGLVLLLFQNIITRSINLNDYDTNFLKFSNRFKNKLYLNKINWKY